MSEDPAPRLGAAANPRLMPTLLAFDTATDRLHIGLAAGARLRLHESEGGARASTALIPRVRELLADAGLGWNDLDAIGFGRGPGAFTGLRTACAAAQGLAWGANKPVLALDTLLAVATDARARSGADEVWVAMDARMDEIYAAHYCCVDGRWQTLVAPALTTPPALHERWRRRPPSAVAGSALNAFGERLDTGGAQRIADARPDARALLACARAAWADGAAADPALALPLYLRDRVALTTTEREAARAARAAV